MTHAAIIKGGDAYLLYTNVIPQIDQRAKAAVSKAGTPAPKLPKVPPGTETKDDKVYCHYCASREHDWHGHAAKKLPITRACAECNHLHARKGPLGADCTHPGCNCKGKKTN